MSTFNYRKWRDDYAEARSKGEDELGSYLDELREEIEQSKVASLIAQVSELYRDITV